MLSKVSAYMYVDVFAVEVREFFHLFYDADRATQLSCILPLIHKEWDIDQSS